MKRLVLGIAALISGMSVNAQNKAALYDSTQVEALQEVVVKGVRAQKNAPYAIANIKKEQLNEFSLQAITPGVRAKSRGSSRPVRPNVSSCLWSILVTAKGAFAGAFTPFNTTSFKRSIFRESSFNEISRP